MIKKMRNHQLKHNLQQYIPEELDNVNSSPATPQNILNNNFKDLKLIDIASPSDVSDVGSKSPMNYGNNSSVTPGCNVDIGDDIIDGDGDGDSSSCELSDYGILTDSTMTDSLLASPIVNLLVLLLDKIM